VSEQGWYPIQKGLGRQEKNVKLTGKNFKHTSTWKEVNFERLANVHS
jgi:hypothetical protein